MAAAEGGFVAEHSGTTSTASQPSRLRHPGARFHPEGGLASAHTSRASRLRVGAWILGMLSVLLLVAGIGAAVSTSSPGARGDREATVNLLTALHRATDDPNHRREVPLATLGGDQPSDHPSHVSTDRASGFWFGTARSGSGRCFLLAGRLSNGAPLGRGTLSKDEPCTAAQVRSHLEDKLVKSDDPSQGR